MMRAERGLTKYLSEARFEKPGEGLGVCAILPFSLPMVVTPARVQTPKPSVGPTTLDPYFDHQAG
jgi:hypothetical protein